MRRGSQLGTLVCLLAGLAACAGGQTGSETRKGVPVHNIGDPCSTDDDCRLQLQQATDELRTPSTAFARTLQNARCEPVPEGCAAPQAHYCRCRYGIAGSDKFEALSLGAHAGCSVYGRGLSCLAPAEELADCATGDGCDCARACEQLRSRLQRDDAASIDVEARHADCRQSVCRFVVRIEQRCYAGAWPDASSVSADCALTDEELLARAASSACDAGSCSPALATNSVCDADRYVDLPADAGAGLAMCLQEDRADAGR